MTHTYDIIQAKKGENFNIFYNMNKTSGFHAKCNKPVAKDKYSITPLIWDSWNSQIRGGRK